MHNAISWLAKPLQACRRVLYARAWQRPGLALAAALLTAATPSQAVADGNPQVTRLRVVGGLAGLNQFVRHEQPFWTEQLARASGGRFKADVVPFDRAGVRAQDMLQLLQTGTVPWGTMLLSVVADAEPVLGAVDLAGMNPDIAALRRSVAAFRPQLERVLLERHGVQLLAIYTYPAQVTFCNKPIRQLADLAGRRVRISSVTQADMVEALGGTPVSTPFAEIMSRMKSGNLDCAITGAMSGNTIGLHEVTTHLHTMAVNWGLSVFAVNAQTWAAASPDLRRVLVQELSALEQRIWDASESETSEGVVCNVGASNCTSGRKGGMQQARASADDDRRRREIMATSVLPRWQQRCGRGCGAAWNEGLAQATGLPAKAD